MPTCATEKDSMLCAEKALVLLTCHFDNELFSSGSIGRKLDSSLYVFEKFLFETHEIKRQEVTLSLANRFGTSSTGIFATSTAIRRASS